jgi:hypothetical protein
VIVPIPIISKCATSSSARPGGELTFLFNFSDLTEKRRDILAHGFPYDIRIDAEIPVGDHVSHADDRLPVDFGMAFPYVRRDFTGGLTDYKEVVDDRIVGLGVSAENVLIPLVYACILPIASSMSAIYSL